MARNYIYGSPFKNLNSGRDETSDHENTHRIQEAFQQYLKSEQGIEDSKSFEEPYVTKQRAQITRFGAPLSGALKIKFGKFLADAFCSPKAIYLKGFLVLGFAMLGYKYSIDVQNSYQTGFVLRNYHRFPLEIQQAFKAHDSRYARKWNQQ